MKKNCGILLCRNGDKCLANTTSLRVDSPAQPALAGVDFGMRSRKITDDAEYLTTAQWMPAWAQTPRILRRQDRLPPPNVASDWLAAYEGSRRGVHHYHHGHPIREATMPPKPAAEEYEQTPCSKDSLPPAWRGKLHTEYLRDLLAEGKSR